MLFLLLVFSFLFPASLSKIEGIHQNTSTIPQIVQTCYDFLESHLVKGTQWNLPYHFYRPSLQKYGPSQWLWDSGSHQIVWSHRNVTNSILDLRTMLQMQKSNGFIPEMINWVGDDWKGKFLNGLMYTTDKYTDITQMPVLAFSLRSIYNQTKDIGLLKEFVPKLVRFWEW